MSGVFSVLGPADHRDAAHPERLLSAGRPVSGAEIRVVDPATGKDHGGGGENLIRSDQHMAGYWAKPEATSADGWAAHRRRQLPRRSRLPVHLRVKDMISGGEPLVERVVAEYPGVADVAVIGVPDDRWGEAVKAVVVPAPGATVDEAGLIAHCRSAAGYKMPESVTWSTPCPQPHRQGPAPGATRPILGRPGRA